VSGWEAELRSCAIEAVVQERRFHGRAMRAHCAGTGPILITGIDVQGGLLYSVAFRQCPLAARSLHPRSIAKAAVVDAIEDRTTGLFEHGELGSQSVEGQAIGRRARAGAGAGAAHGRCARGAQVLVSPIREGRPAASQGAGASATGQPTLEEVA